MIPVIPVKGSQLFPSSVNFFFLVERLWTKKYDKTGKLLKLLSIIINSYNISLLLHSADEPRPGQ